MQDHFDRHHILSPLQHGFRRNHSCESQLIITIHDLLQYFDQKTQVDVAILDFSKAFDTVPHARLMKKLEKIGIKGGIHNWIYKFLHYREQKVIVEGVASDPVSVASGVPQGTVLGPLLFLCYINDLPATVKAKIRLFADDCLIYSPIKNTGDQHALQNDLESLSEWAERWGMKFNTQKCHILRISRSKTPLDFHYKLNNHTLIEVDNSSYLGVQISNDLTFTKHANCTVAKANRTLGFLRRNLHRCPKPLKETAYISMVRSVLEYGSTVWSPFIEKEKAALEFVQRRGARFVNKDYSRESSVSGMMVELGWPSLEERRKEARLILFYKVTKGLVAINPTEYLIPQTTCTRKANTQNFQYHHTNTRQFANSFFPDTKKYWNTLPDDAVNAQTVDSFKTILRVIQDYSKFLSPGAPPPTALDVMPVLGFVE